MDTDAFGEHLEVTEGKCKDTNRSGHDKTKCVIFVGLNPRARSMGDTFLVCVHNVSEDQPYAILRAGIHSTAADIIRQVGN